MMKYSKFMVCVSCVFFFMNTLEGTNFLGSKHARQQRVSSSVKQERAAPSWESYQINIGKERLSLSFPEQPEAGFMYIGEMYLYAGDTIAGYEYSSDFPPRVVTASLWFDQIEEMFREESALFNPENEHISLNRYKCGKYPAIDLVVRAGDEIHEITWVVTPENIHCLVTSYEEGKQGQHERFKNSLSIMKK